jgi:hypothetical protein
MYSVLVSITRDIAYGTECAQEDNKSKLFANKLRAYLNSVNACFHAVENLLSVVCYLKLMSLKLGLSR